MIRTHFIAIFGLVLAAAICAAAAEPIVPEAPDSPAATESKPTEPPVESKTEAPNGAPRTDVAAARPKVDDTPAAPGVEETTTVAAPEAPAGNTQKHNVSKLLRDLLSSSVESRNNARVAFGEILSGEEGRPAWEALCGALNKAVGLQKAYIIQCLANAREPETAEIVGRYINDEDVSVRRAVVTALGRLKTQDRTLIGEVRAQLAAEDTHLRKEAALALGRIKDLESVPTLVAMINEEDDGLVGNVTWALKEITGQDFGRNVTGWQMWWDVAKKDLEPGTQTATTGPNAGGPVAAAGTPPSSPAAVYSDEETTPAASSKPWLLGLLGLILFGLLAWYAGCRWWLAATLSRLLRLEAAVVREPATIAMRFTASDMMPDFIVIPFLHGRIEHGTLQQAGVAMHVLMFRIHGGCARTAANGGRLSESAPRPEAGEWIRKLPRGLLADLAIAGNPASRYLLRLVEPDNPSWRRDPTPREKLLAERHLASISGRR